MAANNNHDCSTFKAPSSLKELLDFYDKLDGINAGSVKKAVLDDIKNRLIGDKETNDGWIQSSAIDKFYRGQNGFMLNSIQECRRLRNTIQNGDNKYNNVASSNDDPCVKKYADAIIDSAFPLFGCLFYLWFMCDNGANTIKKNGTSGGNFTGWKEQKLDGNGGSDGHLNKFLTDDPSIKTNNKFSMLTRGFKDAKLNGSNQGIRGETIFNHAEKLFDIGSNDTTGQLQNVLFFLLFLAPSWYPAMSGHALLFLDWFNEKASQAPFNDLQWCHVKGAGTTFFGTCTRLTEAIKKLAEGSNGNGANISPVYINSISKDGNGTSRCNMYSPSSSSGHGHTGKTILHNTSSFKDNDKKAHVFMQYVSWLWWCIPHLTESLKEMKEDSENWKENNFKSSETFGPFAFGFTFTDNTWTTGNGTGLQGKLNNLITAIEHFRDRHIGAFFWAIRRPFAMGSLIAWIVAFTFLLYVNLLPLDLFHLKSHLLASSSFYRSDVIHSTLISNVTDVSYFKIF